MNLVERTIEAYSEPNGQGDAADYRVCVFDRAEETLPVMLYSIEVDRMPIAAVFPQ